MLNSTFECGVTHPHPHEDMENATSKALAVVTGLRKEGWSSAKACPNLCQVVAYTCCASAKVTCGAGVCAPAVAAFAALNVASDTKTDAANIDATSQRRVAPTMHSSI